MSSKFNSFAYLCIIFSSTEVNEEFVMYRNLQEIAIGSVYCSCLIIITVILVSKSNVLLKQPLVHASRLPLSNSLVQVSAYREASHTFEIRF